MKDGEKVCCDDEKEAGAGGFRLRVFTMRDNGKDENEDSKEKRSIVAGATGHESCS